MKYMIISFLIFFVFLFIHSKNFREAVIEFADDFIEIIVKALVKLLD